MFQIVRVIEQTFSTSFFRGNVLKSVLITFSGIDGAGKSTQIEKLHNHLMAEGIPVRQLAFWDHVAVFRTARSGFSRHILQSDGSVGSPDRPAARRDKNLQSWPLFMGRSILHLLDVVNLWRVVRKEKTQGVVIIFDRYIYDQLAALPMKSAWARAFAQAVLRLAPKPDISYLLDAVPEEALARKPEYPLEFMRRYRSSYLELRDIAGMELIAAGDPEVVHAAILERFSRCVANPCPEPEVHSAVVA
jgi:thymidylate kinase